MGSARITALENVWFHCGREKIPQSLVDLTLYLLEMMHSDLRRTNLSVAQRDSFEAQLVFLISDENMLNARAAIRKI